MEKKIRVSPKLKLISPKLKLKGKGKARARDPVEWKEAREYGTAGKARAERSHDLHFAGYDFTSGPRGTTIHRQYLGAPASSGKSTFKL